VEIIAIKADEHVSRRICMRLTRRCDGVEWESVFSEAKESDNSKGLTDVEGECDNICRRLL